MKNVILSLKSIYMVLMNEDFPNYSESVIARSDRKGLTMIRFWQGMLSPEFRSLPCGQMLWRSDGPRNRYTSYLCNRSKEIRNYQAYAQELGSQICEDSLKNQISLFTKFLSARKYRHDVLLQRIRDLMQLAQDQDPPVTEGIAHHILHAIDWQPPAGPAITYQAAYLLTMLSLYAASGEAMDSPDMKLLQAKAYEIGNLWNSLNRAPEPGSHVTYLTVHSGLLQDNRLPKHRFFGRDEELFELKELAATGAKRQIVGIGGIGKTELLRQLIRVCEEDRVVDQIAVVPYEGDLMESFAWSFPDFWRDDPEQSFRSILHRLTKAGQQEKVLLLIDNLTNTPETDPALAELLSLPCGVLITARHSCIEGMDTLLLSPPSIGTGTLIFRDNYSHPITPEDRKCLQELLTDEALCIPLTLRLMASAARSRGWSVETLKTQLAEQDALSWQENDRIVRLSQIYRQLYSRMQLPNECRLLAELFTLLPRDNYPLEFLRDWFPECMGADPEEKLTALVSGGWLEHNKTGYSMHPLIAQCLRRRVINQEHLLVHFGSAVEKLCRLEWADADHYGREQSQRIAASLCCATDYLSGTVDKPLMCAFLRSGSLLMLKLQENTRFLKRAQRMLKRCTETDDRVRLLYSTACGHFDIGNKEEIQQIYASQKLRRTVPERMFLDFCLNAGICFVFNQEHATAEPYLMEVMTDAAAPAQKAAAYHALYGCYDYRGDREKGRQFALEGSQYALDHPEIGDEMRVRIMSLGCQMEILFGNREEARKWLARIKAILEKNPRDRESLDYETAAAAYELTFGNPEKAYTHYRNTLDILDHLWDKDATYYLVLGQMATVLQRLKRYAESIESYLELLAYAKETDNTAFLSLFSNNLAVAYLELEQPENALPHLDTALELVRPQGGIALAEALRNRARAYRQLGDKQQEYACLAQASPLLDAVYGADHPRAAAARERLAELAAELNL